MWFTDHGRDWMGDNAPEDELNRLSRPGQFFGFPYCHANGVVDKDIRKADPCGGVTLPVVTTGPHSATMGIHFYTGTMFPPEYRNVPAMKGMLHGATDAEIVELANYFSAQKPLPAASGAPDEATFRRGHVLATRGLCGSCHLPDYSGRQQIPRLAGQHEAFLLQSLKQFRDHPGPGRDTIMAASLYGLKDKDLADLAHYLAHYR